MRGLQHAHIINAVTDGKDLADLLQFDLAAEVHNFCLDDRRELSSRGLGQPDYESVL